MGPQVPIGHPHAHPLLSASYVQQSATGRRTQVPTRPDATCTCMASMARSLSLRSATAIASSSAKTVVAAAVNVHAVTIELVTTLTEITIELTGGDDVWGNGVPVLGVAKVPPVCGGVGCVVAVAFSTVSLSIATNAGFAPPPISAFTAA